jgi:hypothetical protein
MQLDQLETSRTGISDLKSNGSTIKLCPLVNLLKLGIFKASIFLIYYTLVLIN